MTRRFEFVSGTSAKFWQVIVTGNNVDICYGRLGTSGQRLVKSFATSTAAQHHAESLVAQKLKKGYREVSVV